MSQNNFKSSSTNSKLAKIAAHFHYIMLASLLHATFIKNSAHELLKIPHMNFEMIDDSAHKFWTMILQVQH